MRLPAHLFGIPTTTRLLVFVSAALALISATNINTTDASTSQTHSTENKTQDLSTKVLIRAKRQCCYPTQMVCCQQPQPIPIVAITGAPVRSAGCDCLRLRIQACFNKYLYKHV
ncbi:hypothetical protein M3Y97_00094800 [Aphelenchoides bicaudatus]|nr:hypothetical protein M3Y97_00094800 [Aphelenchoides bicaudatus]